MFKKDIQNLAINNIYWPNYSDNAKEIITDLINELEDSQNYNYEELSQKLEIYDIINIVYYSDALKFLEHNNYFDWEDAINSGWCKNIIDIANYYLNEELNEIINDIIDQVQTEEEEEGK